MKLQYVPISLAIMAIAGSLFYLPLAASAASLSGQGSRLMAVETGAVQVRADVLDNDIHADFGAATNEKSDLNDDKGSTSNETLETDADFTTFAKAETKNDADVHGVAATEKSVSVAFTDHARFFWLFPTTLTATTTVNADGTITFNYPWYNFFFSTHRAAIRGQFEALAHSDNSVFENGTATLSVAQKARILKGMHSILSAQASVSANN